MANNYTMYQGTVAGPKKKASTSTVRTNTTKNKRAGRKFTTIYTSKGAVHDYGNGETVLVKSKKKKTAPTYGLK